MLHLLRLPGLLLRIQQGCPLLLELELQLLLTLLLLQMCALLLQPVVEDQYACKLRLQLAVQGFTM